MIKPRKAHIIPNQLSRIHNGEKVVGIPDDFLDTTLFNIEVVHVEWYQDIIEFLITGQCPQNLDKVQKRNLIRKAKPYQLIGGELYRLGPDDILRRCIQPHEVQQVLSQAQEGVSRGYRGVKNTQRKILTTRFW